MVNVQIRLVKKLQTQLQETNFTILKHENEIIFLPSFISIGSFLRPRCFRIYHEFFHDASSGHTYNTRYAV